jgi:hypothetical protein
MPAAPSDAISRNAPRRFSWDKSFSSPMFGPTRYSGPLAFYPVTP